jgi:flagellar basal-body rod modification protein FlgD
MSIGSIPLNAPLASAQSPSSMITAGSASSSPPASAAASSDPSGFLSALGAPSSGTPTSAAASQEDQFLKLLVAQLQHQDPLTPQDGSAFVAQLAQFASLEQSATMNQHLANLETEQASGMRTGYANLVGKTITAKTTGLDVPPPAGSSLSINLGSNAQSVEVDIVDPATGKTVRTMQLGAEPSGKVQLPFDGMDDSGQPLPNGHYKIAIQAKGSDGSAVTANADIQGTIGSIDFNGGNVNFHLGSLILSPGDIESIDQ